MKHFLRLALAASLTVALASCTKEKAEINPADQNTDGLAFEISAGVNATKTETDAELKTSWTAGDSLIVFHAEAGTTNYINDGMFKLKEAGAVGQFTGTLAEALTEGKSYDWYVVYPYNEDITSPAAATFKYNQGAEKPGNGETVNLSTLPLWSNVKGLASDQNVSFTMHQVYALGKVIMKNCLQDVALTNFSISVSSEYDLYTLENHVTMTGDIDFDITGEAVSVSSSTKEGAYKPSHATIAYGGSETLALNDSWTVYFPLIPQVHPAGEALTFTPNQGSMRKTVVLKEDINLKAGEVTTFNVNFDKSSLKISEAEMANPILFRFCMPTDKLNITAWQDVTKSPRFFSTLDHKLYVQDFNGSKVTRCGKAYLSILENQTDKPKIADSKGRWYLATGKIQEGQSFTVNAKYAKYPAGKKSVFHTSLFLASDEVCFNYSVNYSLDGGATYKPASVAVETAIGDTAEGNTFTLAPKGAYTCHPLIISTEPATADIDDAQLIIKITLGAANSGNNHIGFAPYYKYDASENNGALRSYRSKKEGTDATTHEGPYAWQWITSATKASVPGDIDDITGCAYLTLE